MRTYHKAITKGCLIGLLFLVPTFAQAATLFLSPESDSYTSGKVFTVRVKVSTSQAMNAVSGTLDFPADKLQVTSVSKVGSILTLWVQDPSYSNSDGKVSFEGVVPNPGFAGSGGLVAVVTFKVVGTGTAKVNFEDASVLANDGNGTDILQSTTPGTYALGGVIAPIEPVDEDSSAAGTPRAPVITSSTHPVPGKWYSISDAKFSWTAGSDVMTTRVLLGKIANSTPTVEYTPPITTREIDSIGDGLWYFHVQNKNSKGWGGIAHYILKIDSTPPESFVMKEVPRSDATDPKARLSLVATDNASGIKDFGIQIDKNEALEWADDGTGIYVTNALTPGEHTIFARAYDEAGNFATASINVSILGIETPKITSYTEKVSEKSPLIVRGTALPDVKVRLALSKDGDTSARTQDTKSDSSGSFSIRMDTKDLESGAYDLTATAIDGRGAQSEPSSPKTVLINPSFLRSLGSWIVNLLTIVIPIAALLLLLLVLFMRGYNHVKMTNKKFKRNLNDVERLVDRAFVVLKEDVEDSIRLLERTKSRRRLTEEEDAIIERLRQNLEEAEKVIHNEMRKIEREI